MEFKAEIKQTRQIKKALDNEYQLTLVTDNPMIMDLGKLPSDTVVNVTIELDNQNGSN